MNEKQSLGDAVRSAGSALFERVTTYLPSVLGAVLLLVVGWVLARVVRALTRRWVLLLDALFARLTRTARPPGLRVSRASTLLGAIAFWVVLLFFATAATHVLGLQSFTQWLAGLLDYLPTLAAGLLIVALGYVLSRSLADLVQSTATRLAPPQRAALARLSQGVVLVAAVLVGAEQIGIKITFLAVLAAAVAVAALGGVTVAVSLGAREFTSNLIGAHYLRQAYGVGQRVRVAGHEGRILEVNQTQLVLETDEGRVALPGRVFHDEPIVVVARASDA